MASNLPGLELAPGATSHIKAEIEYRLRYIVQEALKLARHARRHTLLREDIQAAYSVLHGRQLSAVPVPFPTKVLLTQTEESTSRSLAHLLSSRVATGLQPHIVAGQSREAVALLSAVHMALTEGDVTAACRVLRVLVREADAASTRRLFPTLLHMLAEEQLSALALEQTGRQIGILRAVATLLENDSFPVDILASELLSFLTTALLHRPALVAGAGSSTSGGGSVAAAGPRSKAALLAEAAANRSALQSCYESARTRCLAAGLLETLLRRLQGSFPQTLAQATAVFMEVSREGRGPLGYLLAGACVACSSSFHLPLVSLLSCGVLLPFQHIPFPSAIFPPHLSPCRCCC